MTTQRCFYEILGVARTANDDELKSAFRKAALKHHPDKNPGDAEAEGRFKEINEAYGILSDAQKRAAYDRFGHAAFQGGGGGGHGGFAGGAGFENVEDIFSQMFGDAFGDAFGGRRSNGPARGADVRYDLEITLEQAYSGAEVEVSMPSTFTCETCDGSGAKPGTTPQVCPTCGGGGRTRASNGFFSIERTCGRCNGSGRVVPNPCSTCHGHGQVRRERKLSVRIPGGVDDGQRIRLTGEGEAGQRGGPRGDLYLFISVSPHNLFERDGLDLLCTVPVPMAVAALGGEIEAPCLKAEGCEDCRVPVSVPEGAQTGKTIRIKGRGMPNLNGRQRGDLVVELYVETPVNLSAKQKELLRQFNGACGDKQHPKHAGFFEKAGKFWENVTGG